MKEENNRITTHPEVMGGKPCIRGMRVTVDTIAGLLQSGVEDTEILRLYPYLEAKDIEAVRKYTSK